MRIIIDADACPGAIKQILYKTANRYKLDLVLVANQYMRVPQAENISCVVAPSGPDEADNKIVEMMESGDLIITDDIPLADRVIKKGGVVINNRGELLTENNIGERLSVRDLMQGLRDVGMETGGPKSFSPKDKQNFTNQLDRFLTKIFQKP